MPLVRGFLDRVPRYHVNGVEQARSTPDKRTVVMPASYAVGGHPVDLSGVFSEIHEVHILRAYVTATKAPDGRVYQVNETGSDTFANRKFRVQADRVPAPEVSTDADVLKASGAPANVTADDVGTLGTDTDVLKASGTPANVQAHDFDGGGSSCSLNCDGTCLRGTDVTARANLIQAVGAGKATVVTSVPVTARQDLVQAAGAGKVTALTGVSAPATALQEVDAAVDLSAITVEYEVVGVLA